MSLSPRLFIAVVALASISTGLKAQEDPQIEEQIVLGASTTFGSSVVSDSMRKQQSTLTSINAVIDNLPGVSISEGDTYGFDDWSTNISLRGFTTSLDEQQVGTTIDGLPNGNSNYGGGAKANRYIDPANLGGVEVSQGTADIASRSHESLGGTINYLSDMPSADQRVRAELSIGEFDAQRVSLRYDSGQFAGNTRTWISYAHQEATDWIDESAENERDHFAAKLVSDMGATLITAYISYDDTQEDNYQRVYSSDQFAAFPESDFLTSEWTGVPYVDQLFRQGWSTLRENLFAYVKADFQLSENVQLSAAIYQHQNEGRGDWVPPYLIDVTDDLDASESEFLGGTTASTGTAGDTIYFVDADGVALSPTAGCVSSIVTIYGQASAAADPACYEAGAIAVQSYRHTHYEKDRSGLTLDLIWDTELAGYANEVRAGLWYEDATRDEYRDWHRILDTSVGPDFDADPYWIQYSRSYPQESTKWYIQNSLDMQSVTISAGVKQFLVDVERLDLFGESNNVALNSDSDVLFSGGLVAQTAVEGMEVFVGYAENFKAISDLILERPDADIGTIEPESSTTTELGVRYVGGRLNATATYYQNDFDNRLIFVSATTATGPNYTIGTDGSYFNAGGIESSGLELAADYALTDEFSLYLSYSMNDASYLGTADTAVDDFLGLVAGNEVVGIAENQFVASLDWAGDHLSAGVSAKFTGERYADTANTWLVDSYVVTDAYLGTTIDNMGGFLDGMNLNLVVNNMLDEDYLGSVVNNGAWIGAPRTVSLSASFDF